MRAVRDAADVDHVSGVGADDKAAAVGRIRVGQAADWRTVVAVIIVIVIAAPILDNLAGQIAGAGTDGGIADHVVPGAGNAADGRAEQRRLAGRFASGEAEARDE